MDADARMRLRLSVMMALVWSVQGAFWPVLSIHLVDLGISERGRGWIFATMAIAAFVTPLGAGQLVDRLMPTQRFLSWSFTLGSIVLAIIASGVESSALGLFSLFLAFWLILAPSYSPSNSLAFRNLSHPDRDFPRVRPEARGGRGVLDRRRNVDDHGALLPDLAQHPAGPVDARGEPVAAARD